MIIFKEMVISNKKKFIAYICIFIIFVACLIAGILVMKNYRKVENFDSYTRIWSYHLFTDKNLKVSGNDTYTWPVITFSNYLTLQILTNYHNLDLDNIYDKSAEMHIMIDGEPTDIANPEDYDIIISTKRNMENSIFLPYYIFHCVEAKLDINNFKIKYNNYSQRKFAVFAYSNCDEKFSGVKRRREFYEKLKNRFGNKLSNLGTCYNEQLIERPTHVTHVENSNKFKEFKFVIAFENKEIAGYVSEKLINPIFAGCIPVYCGAPDVAKYINPKRFINVKDFSSDEEVFNRMVEIDKDPKLFNQIVSEPPLVQEPSIYNEYSFLLGKGKIFIDIYNKAPLPLQDMMPLKRCVLNKIVMCTFADGKKYTTKRIKNEAENSDYFDNVISYSPLDLSSVWSHEEVGKLYFDTNFIMKENRGYGYMTWKPYIILKALCQNCENGDVLVYNDSGCTVEPFMTSKMMEYVNGVTGDTPILAFPMLYKEKFWTKGDLIDRIFYNTTTEEKDIALNSSPYQFTSATIILRKCKEVIQFIKEWHNIAQEKGHRYIDDSISLNHKDEKVVENRYDQSIFSLLCKKNRHLVTKSMDFQVDSPLNSTQRVIFKRKRNKN